MLQKPIWEASFKNVLRDPATLDYYVTLSAGLRTPVKTKRFRVARYRRPYLKDIERLKLGKRLDQMLHECDVCTWWNCFVRSAADLNAFTVYMA